ncbi:MAG: Maf family protein [Phycisphaerales bacterium]|nr:Maf family protein [Phycisphaerales bacterium]
MTRVFLSSSSPRRRMLLEQAGVPFEWADPGVDDSRLTPGEVTPPQWVASLAFLKASAGLLCLPASEPGLRWVSLGADTLVLKAGDLVGQPRSPGEAGEIIRRLRNGTHHVLTGVAIIDPRTGDRHMLVDKATVHVGDLSDEVIDRYVASGGWRGKAGGYNLHERLHEGWPIEFEGDDTTIVGLPMGRLLPMLTRLGVDTGAAV